MTTKELLKQIAIIIYEEFDQFNKKVLASLQDIKKGQNIIHRDMATKADIKELRKTIDDYMKITTVYKEKQLLLEEKIEAILEYLDINND